MPPFNVILLLVLHGLLWMWLSIRFIHLLQLESYQNRMYIRALFRNRRTALWPLVLATGTAVVGVLLIWMLPMDQFAAALASPLWTLLVGAGCALWLLRRKQKKPLVYTARVKRLMACVGIVCGALAGLVWTLSGGLEPVLTAETILAGGILFVPLFVLLGAFIAYPLEAVLKRKFFNQARRKLAANDRLIRIGITGSYGKTSTKFILGTILSQRYKTLITPHSYNTPMGVSRVIRESDLDAYEVFVCEMGARYRGDIRELCDLVHPQYGLITSVGKQHLETFRSMEGVIQTKYELIEALPEDGYAFFPADNEICLELYDKTQKPKALFGFEGQGRNLDMAVDDFQTGPEGSEFVLIDRAGERAACRTRLLGRHNIQNILAAACVAKKLGLTLDEIAQGIAAIEPVEHRLQLIHGTNGVNIIDDAFNANPDGAQAALDVLSSFDGGKKIIVTPGLVELGREEDELNRAFGRGVAQAVDVAILVGGARTVPLQHGLREAGFVEAQIHIVANLEEATSVIGRIARAGDVVLFENDLPDNYDG